MNDKKQDVIKNMAKYARIMANEAKWIQDPDMLTTAKEMAADVLILIELEATSETRHHIKLTKFLDTKKWDKEYKEHKQKRELEKKL